MKLLLSILAAFCLAGCASFNASKFKADAAAALGSLAVDMLQNMAAGNGDYRYSAAQAVWSAVNRGDVKRLIVDAGGSPALADAAQSIVLRTPGNERAVLDAVASAIVSSK